MGPRAFFLARVEDPCESEPSPTSYPVAAHSRREMALKYTRAKMFDIAKSGAVT